MSGTATHDFFRTVEVQDPNGQDTVLLEGLRGSATVAEIKARATAELKLPPDVTWNLRQQATGRLLKDDQHLSDFAQGSSPEVSLALQPDASLG